MAILSCGCRPNCTVWALIISAVLGVLAAFLQITGVITVAAVFLWVVFAIAVVYLGSLLAAEALARPTESRACQCSGLETLLAGILGTILLAVVLLAVVLLAVGIVATSVVSAILVGLLVFFFSLTLGASACYVRCLSGCGG